jgi:hypothetical protein
MGRRKGEYRVKFQLEIPLCSVKWKGNHRPERLRNDEIFQSRHPESLSVEVRTVYFLRLHFSQRIGTCVYGMNVKINWRIYL